MGRDSSIEWTDHTFNPWHGCSHAGTPGCDHCYARDFDRRFGEVSHWGPAAPRKFMRERYWNDPRRWSRLAREQGRRERVFCGSMCDVFDGDPRVSDTLGQLFALITDTPWLDWLLLTKRPEKVRELVPRQWCDGSWPDNVAIGTTIETQASAIVRLPHLLALPAPLRFVSTEPLLGELVLTDHLGHAADKIGWVVAGGENGAGARPLDPASPLWLRDQCRGTGVPFLFKGWGRWMPVSQAWRWADGGGSERWLPADCKHNGECTIDGQRYFAVGKKMSGRRLGGRLYDELPQWFSRSLPIEV